MSEMVRPTQSIWVISVPRLIAAARIAIGPQGKGICDKVKDIGARPPSRRGRRDWTGARKNLYKGARQGNENLGTKLRRGSRTETRREQQNSNLLLVVLNDFPEFLRSRNLFLDHG